MVLRQYGSGAPRWKNLLAEVLLRGKWPGRIEGCLFYWRYKIRKTWLSVLHLSTAKTQTKPTVFVSIEEQTGDRYLFQLLSFLCYGGCHVEFFTDKPDRYFRGFEYMRLIYVLTELRMVNCLPADPENTILCFDKESAVSLNRKWRKKIFVNQDISQRRDEHRNSMVIPYPMHPVIYKLGHHKKLAKFRDNKRMLRMFFSGMHGADYRHSILLDRFGKISRPQAIAAIMDSGLAWVVKSQTDMAELLKGSYKNIFALVCTEKTIVFQEHWLDTISRSDSFLALPGDVRPMCHNIIEAMAVGTIPITNYPEWFHPRLEHMKHCIVFDGKEDLIEKIKVGLKMETWQIMEMRCAVIDYYEQHLSPASFARRIQSGDENELELFLNSGNREYLAKVNADSVIISEKSAPDSAD